MIKTHIIGTPIIGKNRELKTAFENYIFKKTTQLTQVKTTIKNIIKNIIHSQKNLDIITVGLFNYPDQLTYTTICLGILYKKLTKKTIINTLIKITRGSHTTKPFKMLKWFGTNFHYFTPEIKYPLTPTINLNYIKYEISLCKKLRKNKIKLALIGPYTLIKLSKLDRPKRLTLEIINRYKKLIKLAQQKGITYFQLEEPAVNNKLKLSEIHKLKTYYKALNTTTKIIFTNYFSKVTKILKHINTYGIHIDKFQNNLKTHNLTKFKLISIGIINGENIWISDLKTAKIALKKLKLKNLLIAPNCSTKHIPYDIAPEQTKIKNLLAFAKQKHSELITLKQAYRGINTAAYNTNMQLIKYFKTCIQIPTISYHKKISPHTHISQKDIKLPILPLTTIGSFPQTKQIRNLRQQLKNKEISTKYYNKTILNKIKQIVKIQQQHKVDVLSNGELERNDMVQYFCEMLTGCYITQNGWVQSYCTRCTKPPIIWGKPKFKNIKSSLKFLKPLKTIKANHKKYIITGPITITKWAFIREDIKPQTIIFRIATSINDALHKIIKQGFKIIQIDEPAIIELLHKNPNKTTQKLIIKAFNICCNNLNKHNIQIQTHICYSNIKKREINLIKQLHTDVLLLEANKNITETIKQIKKYKLTHSMEIGIGIYNVHANIIPNSKTLYNKIKTIISKLNYRKVWINPDCGLKTKNITEVTLFLKRTSKILKQLRKQIKTQS
ncbi:5-methyltetrahydropteroyltriglutamate--homocysteine S-methyltransferase [Candidatus Vidania fulgoroideae]|uniref:5-methyltetrahydropteroyltriglutamate--homocysteine S-methyltransferase n=1 Tax=Candidatus Vidania fulgoroideorum TaxID=881286 RepID=A0A974X778_9PROT|nr:5-methyltetrahydropteroyltriglutamate--homocysteine S-methyltransferase [Candidatus Vidania fulgoroideae]